METITNVTTEVLTHKVQVAARGLSGIAPTVGVLTYDGARLTFTTESGAGWTIEKADLGEVKRPRVSFGTGLKIRKDGKPLWINFVIGDTVGLEATTTGINTLFARKARKAAAAFEKALNARS